MMVENTPIVVPRSSVQRAESLRADTQVEVVLGWDDIQVDQLGLALQKKNGKR